MDGFSLHAAVRCCDDIDDRKALEQLCRYITRPALANVRARCNATGQVVLKQKTLCRDGKTHLLISFMQRPAGLVPRLRRPIPGLFARRVARATASRRPILGTECR